MRPLLGVLLLLLVPALCPAQQLSRLQSRGAVLKGYRTAFALTQAQLATLTHISATRISRWERGLDSARVGAEDTVTAVLDSIFRSRYHPGTEMWLVEMVTRTHLRLLRQAAVGGLRAAWAMAVHQ